MSINRKKLPFFKGHRQNLGKFSAMHCWIGEKEQFRMRKTQGTQLICTNATIVVSSWDAHMRIAVVRYKI